MAVTEELNIIPANTLPNADQEDVNGGKVIIVNSYGDVKKADSLVMKGDKGDKGIQGIQGEKGDTGAKGDRGAQGIQGERGVQGEKGDRGIQGVKGDSGDKGNSVELRETSTHVQWREVGTTTWNNLIPLADLVGETGASIEMQASSTHIQWRVQGSTTWINLISIEALRGNPGKSAYELWLQQPGNAGKPYSEYEAYNREPATSAKNEWNVLKPEITNKITEAGEAISNANTSASNADSKAGLADTAATNANTAASEANTAKEGVLDAIDNANDTAEHPTYIGTDFYVYKWNKATKQYVKTDIFVKGSPGAGNVDIINSPTVKKDVPYVIVPTANAAQTYNAVEAGTLNVDWKAKNLGLWGVQRTRKGLASIYDNVAEFSAPGDLTGVFLITTPIMSGAMCRMIIKIYDGFNLDNQYATVDGTFYNQSEVRSTKGRYILLGRNINIDAVKFGIKDEKLCIIIGDGNKTWNSPRLIIEKVTHTHNNIETDISSGWTIENITEIPDTISQIQDAVLVSRTVTQDELDAKADKLSIPRYSVPYKTTVGTGDPNGYLLALYESKQSGSLPIRNANGAIVVGAATKPDEAVVLSQLNSAISDFNTRFAGQYEIVSVRPAVGVEGKMYLVTTGTANVYNLFTWKSVDGVYQWVDLGSTTVDLSQYAKSADVTSALSNKVDKVSGKGLSTNDFTDEDKAEVAKIANKADLGEDGKVLPSQLPAMSGGLGKPQEIKLLLSDATPTREDDGNYGFAWSLSTDGDSFVENCRFSLSCGDDAMPPLVWYIYVGGDGIAYLYVSFVRGPFTEYLILDRYTGFSNSVAPGSVPFLTPWSDVHIPQNGGFVDAEMGGMFTLTAMGTLNVSFTNLYDIPLGKSLRIRIKGNNSTNRTITITPDGVTNELDNTSYQVNNVKTLELDIVNFGGEYIMKGVYHE